MRRTITASLMALMMSGVVFASAPAASAQTGYPPGPCSPGDTPIAAGSHGIGATFTLRLAPVCAWDPGANVSVTVNGQSVGPKRADAGGGVNVTVTVVSAAQLSVDDPVLVPAVCGDNNASGVGPSAAAQTDVRATATFRVVCQPAAVASATRSGVAFTGANITKWAAVALGLLALGTLLVMGARRRRGAAGSA